MHEFILMICFILVGLGTAWLGAMTMGTPGILFGMFIVLFGVLFPIFGFAVPDNVAAMKGKEMIDEDGLYFRWPWEHVDYFWYKGYYSVNCPCETSDGVSITWSTEIPYTFKNTNVLKNVYNYWGFDKTFYTIFDKCICPGFLAETEEHNGAFWYNQGDYLMDLSNKYIRIQLGQWDITVDGVLLPRMHMDPEKFNYYGDQFIQEQFPGLVSSLDAVVHSSSPALSTAD